MKWQVKAVGLQVLSRVPFGRRLYRKVQATFGRLALDLSDYWPPRKELLQAMADNGVAFEGRRVLEIGTGWHPVLTLVSYLLGARETVSIDINPWLDGGSLLDALRAVISLRADIPGSEGVRGFEDRVEVLRRLEHTLAAKPDTDVRELLAQASIVILCPIELQYPQPALGAFSLVVHTDTFEHIPPSILEPIVANVGAILDSDGWHVLRVCPGDHFADDKAISTLHFLRYSPRMWYFIGGSGLAYHNRLRLSDHVGLLVKGHQAVRAVYPTIDPNAQRDLASGAARLAPEFAGCSEEDLTCKAAIILAHKT